MTATASSTTYSAARSTAIGAGESAAQILVVEEPPTRGRSGKGRWCGTQLAVCHRMDVVAQTAAATVVDVANVVGVVIVVAVAGHELLGGSTILVMVHIDCDGLCGAIAIGGGRRRPWQFSIAGIAVVVIRRLRLLAVLLKKKQKTFKR